MSRLKPPRKPAWHGLIPSQAAFIPVAEEITLQILPKLGQAGILFGRMVDRPGLTGHYHFFPNQDRERPLFLKILPKEELATQLAADRIVRYLHKQGIPTTPLAADFPKTFDQHLVLLACPLVLSRFFQETENDLQALGSAAAKLHNALAGLPFEDEILISTEKRNIQLEKYRLEILAKKQKTAFPLEVANILEKNNCLFPDSDSQIIHGDLNPGNILFARQSGRPFFIDFEDCLHSRLPPIIDLAMLLERCILVRQQSDQLAEEQGKIFLEAYIKRQQGKKVTGDFGRTLRILAVRALTLLTLAGQSGHPPDHEEWRKFIRLFQQTFERQSLLTRLSRALDR